jgi:hypothetical protein
VAHVHTVTRLAEPVNRIGFHCAECGTLIDLPKGSWEDALIPAVGWG